VEETETSSGVLATLSTSFLPIEEDNVLIEGELDFTQLDIEHTLEEISRREKDLDQELALEALENVLTLDEINQQDFAVPRLPMGRAAKTDLRTQPIFEEDPFSEEFPIENTDVINLWVDEPTEIIPRSIDSTKKVVQNPEGPPYFEMTIAFIVTFCTLLILWEVLFS